MRVFQMLYKFFPPFLLPGDARRFFLEGDVRLRRQTKQPRFIRSMFSVLHTWFTEPNWHPLNYLMWRRFVRRHAREVTAYQQTLARPLSIPELIETLEQLRTTTARLLRIHRWSINYAEVFGSLLRTWVKRWTTLRPEQVETLLVNIHVSPTARVDRALRDLAHDPSLLPNFLAEFGHRSFCLDLMCPRYADDPAEVEAAAQRLADHLPDPPRNVNTLERELFDQLAFWQKPLLHGVLFFARQYEALREEQRFEWQKDLYLMRRAFLAMPLEDVFFLHWDEILSGTLPPQAEVAARRREWTRLRYAPYPRFLRGDQPITQSVGSLIGIAASAGQALGPARVILNPGSLGDLLDHVQDGDILVTRATDPGWTPAFGRLGGMVMSLGGQLSHGAIVAREYGITAVVGVGEAIQQIKDGDPLLVNGDTGEVTILSNPPDGD
jgi:phosphohistidine swiveling domain-containing protein